MLKQNFSLICSVTRMRAVRTPADKVFFWHRFQLTQCAKVMAMEGSRPAMQRTCMVEAFPTLPQWPVLRSHDSISASACVFSK